MPDLGRSWTRNRMRQSELDATLSPKGFLWPSGGCSDAENMPSLFQFREGGNRQSPRRGRAVTEHSETCFESRMRHSLV
jgi:hypothetical protein